MCRRAACLVIACSLLALSAQATIAGEVDFPDNVLITGSLIRATDPPPAINEQLTQLADDELRRIWRGARIRVNAISYLVVDCDGTSYLDTGTPSPNPDTNYHPLVVNSIRDNQICLVGAGAFGCFKVYRSEAGTLFSDLYRFGTMGIRLLQMVPNNPPCA